MIYITGFTLTKMEMGSLKEILITAFKVAMINLLYVNIKTYLKINFQKQN